MRPAVLVLDMIADFTTGRMGSPSSRAVRPAVLRLLRHARSKKIPVLYCQNPQVSGDPKLTQTDPMLKRQRGEVLIPKHTFDAFFGTNLEDLLKEKKADTLVLTGICTDVSVQHTAAHAFFQGYRIFVPKDATAASTPQVHGSALRYMARTYGAKITDVNSLLRKLGS